MIEITVDDRKLAVQSGLTILKALSYLSIDIPNLCGGYLDKKNYSCRLCIVKVKLKDEKCYRFSLACKEVVEEGMSILNDDEIIKYRIALLTSIFNSHKLVCEECSVYYTCKLKKYIDEYNIDSDFSSFETVSFRKEIENLPSYIKPDYDRCIDCGICDEYKSIYGYRTMISDFCPTCVFENGDKNISKIEEVFEHSGYCIGCHIMCDARYYVTKKEIVSIRSVRGKRYGICDFSREMKYYDNNTLMYPLKNGKREDMKNARRLYKDFFYAFNAAETGASFSLMYPLEDMKALEAECINLGIKIFGYREQSISTNTIAKKARLANFGSTLDSNINYDGRDTIDIFEENLYKNLSTFFILSDPIFERDEIVSEFAKENNGKYVVFTSNHSILSENAYLAFPIRGLGELSGIYIDKSGKEKYISSFLSVSENRLNIRDLLKYLYL